MVMSIMSCINDILTTTGTQEISSRLSRYSEACCFKFPENPEEMFLQFNMQSRPVSKKLAKINHKS